MLIRWKNKDKNIGAQVNHNSTKKKRKGRDEGEFKDYKR